MCCDQISSTEKVHQLRKELAEMHDDHRYMLCHSMGELTFLNITRKLKLEPEIAFFPEGAGMEKNSNFKSQILN